MKISKAIIFFSIAVALLAAIYASVGLFWQDDGAPFNFTTLHGETVEMYGRGIYRNDAAFRAPIFRGTDAITLFVCVPVLLFAVILYARNSLRGGILLTSMLAYFMYNAASLALGAAYNELLLIYIASFSLSLFAFIMAFTSIDLQVLAERTAPTLAHRGIAIFLFIAGMSLLVWIMDIIVALTQNSIPAQLGPYTTEATYTLDLGIILPTAYLAGVLVWRRSPLGTLLAAIVITLNVSIGLVVASQSIMQALDGIFLTVGGYAAYVAPFVTLSLIAIGLISNIHRSIIEK